MDQSDTPAFKSQISQLKFGVLIYTGEVKNTKKEKERKKKEIKGAPLDCFADQTFS